MGSRTDREGQQARVAELLRSARGRTLVLTGAGISTDSGIPDYRGPDGVRRATPMGYAEFVKDPQARRRYWARAYAGWPRLRDARPNAGHLAVADLQRRGWFGALITQNVDGLHQRAGSTDVIELHGSLAGVVCLECRRTLARDDVQRWLAQANPALDLSAASVRPDGDTELDEELVAQFVPPRCPDCGRDRLKPDVVFFGESVPRERVDECFARVEAAGLLVVLGSSLQVLSGYRFVRRAAQLGIPVVVVTRGVHRATAEAAIHLDAPLGRVLPELRAALTGDSFSEWSATP